MKIYFDVCLCIIYTFVEIYSSEIYHI